MLIENLLILVLLVPGLQSQSIPRISTCPTRTVTLQDSKGFYKIQHTRRAGSSGTCVLTLAYVSSHNSYALIEGISKRPLAASCRDSQIVIGTDNYCIESYLYMAKRAASHQNTLNITTSTDESSFTISVYLSVDICGSESSANSPWSGVVSSPHPGANLLQTYCFFILSGLPPGAKIKFTALFPLNIDDAKLTIGADRVNVVAVGVAVYVYAYESGRISITRSSDVPDDAKLGQFSLVYTVVRCEDIPEIENTTHTSVQPPYLPGSTVQYSCGDNYQLKNKSYITCEEKIQGEAVWSDDVMCIPVTWCLRAPYNIDNTKQIVITTNRTISYECEEGSESTDIPNITVTCSTTDEDRQPWKWNDTNIDMMFQCSPVQCEVAMISNINNGTLDNNNTVTYNYGDTVTYECDAGFKKSTTEPIRCQSDKSWSVLPGCDLVHCTLIPSTPIQLIEVQSNSTGNRLQYGEVITIKCVEAYKLRSQNLRRWTCSQSESWVSSNDDSIAYGEQLLPLCGKSDNSKGDTDARDGILTPRSDMPIIIVSSVLGVVCSLLMIVIVVFIRLYNITPIDIKQRIAKKGARTDQFEAGVENVRHAVSESVISPDEYEDVSVGPAGVKISMDAAQPMSGISGYEQISPRVDAAGSTYENTAYQGDQGDGHEYAKLGQ